MATLTGNNGKIILGGTNSGGANTGGTELIQIKNYSLDMKTDTIETTSMGNDVRQFLKGLAGWSGSADVLFDASVFATAGLNLAGTTPKVGDAATTAIFYLESVGSPSGKAFNGSIIITGFNIKSSMDGLVEGTLSFQGSGSLTYTA